jgi:hypothetical protein
MRNARLAEWILSLVTTPERASATVGDLLEDRRGVLRFWGALLSAAVALLWRDVLADPGRMIRLALYGVFLELVLSLAMAAVVGILYGFVALVTLVISPGTHLPWGPDTPTAVATLGVIASYVFTLAAQFQVGRVLAKRSPGRELAPCIATTLVAIAIPFLIVLLSRGRAEFPTGQSIQEALYGSPATVSILAQIPPLATLLAGAARIRRQRFSSSS